MDVGVNNNKEWAHRGIMFLESMVYENPFYPARLNDDEIAVASCLVAMKEYVETGKEFYPLREALQDAGELFRRTYIFFVGLIFLIDRHAADFNQQTGID